MGIKRLRHENTNVFGIELEGKVHTNEIEAFAPEIEAAVQETRGRLRLLVDITKMHGADIKSEWDIFEFLREHIKDIQLIAIVGAHSWEKIMSEIVTGSVFVEAPTLYFQPEQIEEAWQFLMKAPTPKYFPARKYIDSDKGLFTKYTSPDYI